MKLKLITTVYFDNPFHVVINLSQYFTLAFLWIGQLGKKTLKDVSVNALCAKNSFSYPRCLQQTTVPLVNQGQSFWLLLPLVQKNEEPEWQVIFSAFSQVRLWLWPLVEKFLPGTQDLQTDQCQKALRQEAKILKPVIKYFIFIP